ncbi:SDR family oxidoreductase [Burkholderia sp. 22313]|uniref:SDR family oxidoreductase n=1 Tax=Burkholderia sp. 22313 TaxID=3453908 RepID=UPI003F855E01
MRAESQVEASVTRAAEARGDLAAAISCAGIARTGLVRCLALDYGRYNIRSNAVCPGFVQTKTMDQLFAEAACP